MVEDLHEGVVEALIDLQRSGKYIDFARNHDNHSEQREELISKTSPRSIFIISFDEELIRLLAEKGREMIVVSDCTEERFSACSMGVKACAPHDFRQAYTRFIDDNRKDKGL